MFHDRKCRHPTVLLSRQYRQWCCRDAVFAWTANEDTVLLYRTYCFWCAVNRVNNNRSLSGDNLLVVNNFQSASKPECRPLGRHILDYPMLLKSRKKPPQRRS